MNLKQILAFTIFLFSYVSSYSQNFIEKQLPSPDNLSSLFIGPLLKPTIHYGKKPSNYNGEVLLFNHGYIDLNQLFFVNNTFYKEAHSAGYQIAFVATTRGKGMWENGELLAESIDIITHKYNVDDVTIIAHSNGGKAAEVAMFSYGKKEMVKKVFALGTPFWGTYLADISQQWWFNWIWSKTGLNEGSETSTTYYCSNVVRPYFDNLATNQPSKFFILGGSGFARGHTILAPLMFTSGAIIYPIQGTNDGVTAYSSSLRPNGNYLFAKGEAKYDHIDLAYGQFAWKHIAPYLNGSAALKPAINNNQLLTQKKASSTYQIVNSENKYDKIILNNKATNIKLEVFHEENAANFELFNNESKLTKSNLYEKASNLSKHKSTYSINSAAADISLKANTRFAAFIHFPDGPKMNYEALKDRKELTVSFENTHTSVDKIDVNAIITKTCDLYGKKIDGETSVHTLNFNSLANNFSLNTSGFDEGVYSIYITGENSNFVRSLAAGFTIGSLSKRGIEKEIDKSFQIRIDLKSNIITNEIVLINKSNNNIKNLQATIYNLNGKRQLHEQLELIDGNYSFNKNIHTLTKGLYIIVIETNNIKRSYKFIKQ